MGKSVWRKSDTMLWQQQTTMERKSLMRDFQSTPQRRCAKRRLVLKPERFEKSGLNKRLSEHKSKQRVYRVEKRSLYTSKRTFLTKSLIDLMNIYIFIFPRHACMCACVFRF